MQRLFLFVALVATLTLGCGRIAQADTSSKRHLVYSFTVGITSDQHSSTDSVLNSGAKGTSSDKGEITVDFLGVEADGGLVVTVSEKARGTRNAGENNCVVYANTNVLCGSGAPANPEEIAVLRTLAPKFFNPAGLDSNRHWHVAQDSAGVSIDFTAKPAGTGVITIDSQRIEKTNGGGLTNANASYTYDVARLIPTTLKEYTTVREQGGVGQYTNYVNDVTATLVSDSLAPH